MVPALGLIIGALLLVRRWAARGGSPGGGEGLRVVTRTGLTRGAMVAVVDVDGQRFLVGAGDHGVTLLGARERPSPFDPPVVRAEGGVFNAVSEPALRRPASDRPWMGLVSRLQRMTVRSHPSRSIHAGPSVRP